MKMDHECIGDMRAPSTVLQPAGTFKENDYCVLKDNPCKIVSRISFKSGLRATSKVRLAGIGIFTGKIYELVCSASTSLEAPVVTRTAYQLIGITEESCAVLVNEAGDVRVT
jgi:translation elongation factor P/translation initiation factor 5A